MAERAATRAMPTWCSQMRAVHSSLGVSVHRTRLSLATARERTRMRKRKEWKNQLKVVAVVKDEEDKQEKDDEEEARRRKGAIGMVHETRQKRARSKR